MDGNYAHLRSLGLKTILYACLPPLPPFVPSHLPLLTTLTARSSLKTTRPRTPRL